MYVRFLNFAVESVRPPLFLFIHRGRRVLWKFASFMETVCGPGTNWRRHQYFIHSGVVGFVCHTTSHSSSSAISHHLTVREFSVVVFPPFSGRDVHIGSFCPGSADVLVALDNSELPLKVDLVIWHRHSHTDATLAMDGPSAGQKIQETFSQSLFIFDKATRWCKSVIFFLFLRFCGRRNNLTRLNFKFLNSEESLPHCEPHLTTFKLDRN